VKNSSDVLPGRRVRVRNCLLFGGMWLTAVALGTAYGAGWLASGEVRTPHAAVGVRASFSTCFRGGGHNCVVDGDTIWLEGTKIRIADIDAPETHEPRCASERQLGDRSTARLRQLLNAGTITLETIDRDEDRYGRKLRIVRVDGVSVGNMLVAEGLARWYAGGRRPWC
jgi:endonuclease YncB( thermonuclease family)